MHQLIQSKAINMAKYRLSLDISKSILPQCVHAGGGSEGNSSAKNEAGTRVLYNDLMYSIV